jgi:hypothetical protein
MPFGSWGPGVTRFDTLSGTTRGVEKLSGAQPIDETRGLAENRHGYNGVILYSVLDTSAAL